MKDRLANANAPVFFLVEGGFGLTVSEIDQTISAVPIEGGGAEDPLVPEGATGLRVDRALFSDDVIVEYTVNLHP